MIGNNGIIIGSWLNAWHSVKATLGVSQYLALTTDAAANTALIVANGGGIVPPGSYPITPVSATIAIKLTGSINSKLYAVSATAGFLIQTTNTLLIDNLTIQGATPGSKASIAIGGTDSAILLSALTGSKIINSTIYDFGGQAISMVGNPSPIYLGGKVYGCNIYNCFSGIETGTGTSTTIGEYSVFTNNTINFCRIGYSCRSGNTIFSSNSLSNNGYGIEIYGESTNGSHGAITSNLVNHSTVMQLYAHNCAYGMIVTQNHFFSAGTGLTFTANEGFRFENNHLLCSGITASGTKKQFINKNWFLSSPVNSIAGNAEFFDNWDASLQVYIGGKSSFQAGERMAYTQVQGATGNQLVANGTFDTTSNWTAQSGWVISGGVATATACSTYLYQAIGATLPNQLYVFRADITLTGGSYSIGIGGSLISVLSKTVTGTQVEWLVSTGAGINGILYIVGINFTGTFDNVTVYLYETTGTVQNDNLIAAKSVTIAGVPMYAGTGSPEGVVTAPVGSEYTRKDGTAGTPSTPGTLKYVKTSGTGNTGWSAVL